MMPLSERVLALLAARLAGVTTDVAGTPTPITVLRSVATLSPADLPAAILWDAGETVADSTGSGNYASMTITLTVTIDVHVPADQATTGAALECAKAACKAALLLENGALRDANGAIGVLTYTGCDAQARHDGAASEAISLHFAATYREAVGDPTRSR